MATGVTSVSTVEGQLVASIGRAVEAGDLKNAFNLATMAMNRGISHRTIFNARGLAFQAAGQQEKALTEFRRALLLTPRDPTLLNAIAVTLFGLERYTEAIETLDRAIAIDPRHAYSHYRRGMALAMMGDHDAAEIAYRRVLEIDPVHAAAIGSLASIAARRADTEAAHALAGQALELVPNEPMALHALATIDIADKAFSRAEQRLRELLSLGTLNPMAKAAALGLLGDALDGQKRYAEAFAVYRIENAELRQRTAHKFSEGRGADAARHILSYFESAPAERWGPADEGGPVPDGLAGHVFLLGFMRSGTTLLEQVLASNPNVVALEEKATLTGLGQKYMTSNEGLDALSNLNGEQLQRDRRQYWDRVNEHNIALSGKIFLDKQPLNTIKLPVIAKLFPKAKILFALRDPRDVVFSCFRRHFRVNVTMFEFLDLEDAARFYASVMRLAELYREKLQLNLFEHRYEDMVEDFDGRVRAVCDFLGIGWTDTMRNFNKLAPAVDLRSPSATQVRRPLYGQAVAQWRNYEEQLAPMLPILQPWVEKFGYPN
jgi:tetratricopeptide (TPR) repeat protein